MIRLALISSTETSEAYGALITRLHRAVWTVYAPANSGESGQALGKVTEAASADAILADQTDAFDALVIDTDPASTARLAKAASSLSKPILAGPAGGKLGALGQADTLLMPAHPWRFIPSIQSVKRSIDAGKLGQAGLLRIHRWLPPDEGGGSLSEHILPDADLACWLFGGAPKTVWSLQSAANPDYIQFHLGFANDGMAMIDVAASLPSGGDYFSLTMIGDTGAVYADDHHNMNLLYAGGQPNAIRTSQGRSDLADQLQEFVDAIGEQREATVTLADTSRAAAVAAQVIESAQTKKVVEGRAGN
ncbi:MAG: Gfo/Idh/MocA family oxidoreductase [Verrucomicrobiota bacterium]|nr:Gfo/Idh/MocA family oxidoreductase [Verrucomicrobiota bacterium]MDP7049653.1 Gfo/Idh/MocA family oxidoreductase [Verrucomicrobiota bacterium]